MSWQSPSTQTPWILEVPTVFGTPPENDRELAALVATCTFNPEADVPTAPTIVVNFMRVERRFHAGRIESNKATIAHWFTVLPDAFTAEGGSYLEATATNYGSKWTHRLKTVKLLVLLGVAADLVELLPDEPGFAFLLPANQGHFRVKSLQQVA